MSIIERYSPLNLAYQVVIVTNASSPLGIVVCNTLLKSNALVLATDSKAKAESFSEGAYTHFQFHRCGLGAEGAARDIVADAKEKFKVERVDALVNIGSAEDDERMREGHRKLALACADVMEAQDGGAIVNAFWEAAWETEGGMMSKAVETLAQTTKETSSKVSQKVRCNMIAPSSKSTLCVTPRNCETCWSYRGERLAN